ncbi:hypothetical protein CDAR_596791 [Caerostris darwini]|uniref:Uncharacterized protein n=1 Tax=Caerostris darwini TaxID=1538125 RepID=A0AAV4WET5_9ARAC|nr:hypothetical protein CDAR_596791 [Caerostris darwini]
MNRKSPVGSPNSCFEYYKFRTNFDTFRELLRMQITFHNSAVACLQKNLYIPPPPKNMCQKWCGSKSITRSPLPQKELRFLQLNMLMARIKLTYAVSGDGGRGCLINKRILQMMNVFG